LNLTLILIALILKIRFRKQDFSILFIVIIVGVISMWIKINSLQNETISDNLKSSVEIVGVIRSDPNLKSGNISGSIRFEDHLSFLLRTEHLNNIKVHLPLRVHVATDQKMLLDQRIQFKARLVNSKEKKVSALAIAQGSIKVVNQPRAIYKYTENIRGNFRDFSDGSKASQLVPGLVLGDTSLQSESFKEEMRKVGLSHLTAVSGANFVLVATFLFWFLQFIVKKIEQRTFFVVLFLILFIILVRPTPSVLRAFVMTVVLLAARIKGEINFGISSLGFAVLILLLFDPFQAIDPGFALSVLATAGILILSPILKMNFSKRIKQGWLIEAITIPISAIIFCLPIILIISNEFSIASIPANIIVAPIIAPITIVGFLSAMVTPLLSNVGEILFNLASFLAKLIVSISEIMNQFPVIRVNNPISLIFMALLLLIIFRKKLKKSLFVFLGLIVFQIVISATYWPGREWQIVNCDVGQGDGLVFNLGDQSAIVIDTGADAAAIGKCLRDLKVKNIPLLILTHFHFDHVGAISAVRSGRKIGQVWISNLHEPISNFNDAMKALEGLPVKSVTAGQRFIIPQTDAQVLVLWPDNQMTNFKVLPGDGSKVNNSSISVIVKNNLISLFAGGDIEPEVQQRIAESKLLIPVDVLKVSHHGSAYQFLPLIDALNPRLALISVGKGNRYGHPDPKLIRYLSKKGIIVLRTDLSGGISVASTNKIRVSGKEWWKIWWD
jgi:competence protein ComEC